MSIEKLIEGLTAAIEENTEQQKRIADTLEAGAAKGKAKGDEDEAPRGRGRRKEEDEDDVKPARGRRRDDDDDDEDDKKSRGRKKDDDDGDDKKSGRGSKKDKQKKTTLADVRAALADLMNVDDQDESDDINGWVEAMLKHLKVKKASEIDEADFEDVLRWVADVKDNGVPRKPKFD